MAAVADPLPKHAVDILYVLFFFFVVDNVVYMGTVNKTWSMICVVYSSNEQVRKRDLKALETQMF